MLKNARCETCVSEVDGCCDCPRSPYLRYWCALIPGRCCDVYSRRPEPLPQIGGGVESGEESDGQA